MQSGKHSKLAVIYALIDPRTNRVRYIGRTTNPIQRLKTHLTRSKFNTVKDEWVSGLKIMGITPQMKWLCLVKKHRAHFIEGAWIRHVRSTNSDLLNSENVSKRQAPCPRIRELIASSRVQMARLDGVSISDLLNRSTIVSWGSNAKAPLISEKG